MKVAIVHDDLMRRGGAEKVALTISELFPEAPIYTLAYQPDSTYPEFKSKKIHTTWFQYLARNEFWMKWLFFPFGLLAMKSLNIKEFDLVIISTTYCGKYVKIDPKSTVVAYCYTPFRLAWNPSSYSVYSNSKGIVRYIFNRVIHYLKKIDFKESKKIDYFIAMTKETKQRLIEAYKPKNKIPIINPSVELDDYEKSNDIGDYYLIVSRLEPYKKVDLAIKAFNISEKKLVVVGKGSMKSYLKNIAKENIEFREMLSNSELARLYKNCKGFVFPQYEDYGLTPIEANAAGRPVIAYGKGGIQDTMIPYQQNKEDATAFFFYEQSIKALNEAIENFERVTFAPEAARKNAERFSKKRFKKEIISFIDTIIR